MCSVQIKPVVCAVGEDYYIMIPTKCEALVKVRVGDTEYFNHSNGIRRSDTRMQRVFVPGYRLNEAGEYTVVFEKVIKRLDYSCLKEPAVSETFTFRPLTKTDGINIYHLSDCHGTYKPSVKAAQWFGDDLDLLVLNGDIASHSTSINDIMLSYKIAYDVTKGSIPVIISRGNHDLRGKYAEQLENLLPSDCGRSYYNVRLGSLWCSLVDCGEDKEDRHREYGGTAAYHSFRLDETEFLKKTVAHAACEYDAPGVEHKIIISHVPITKRNTEECRGERPFDIENDIYNEWCDILKTSVRPDFLLAGHFHQHSVWRAGGPADDRGVPFDVVIGGKPFGDGKGMIGAAITLNKDDIKVVFTDNNKKVYGEETVRRPEY